MLHGNECIIVANGSKLISFGKRMAQPKIFFSQACRGEIKMKCAEMSDHQETTTSSSSNLQS